MTENLNQVISHYLVEAASVPSRMRNTCGDGLDVLEPIAFSCKVLANSRWSAEDGKLIAFQKALEKHMYEAKPAIIGVAAATMHSYILAATQILRATIVAQFHILQARAYENQLSYNDHFCDKCQENISAILDISNDHTPLDRVIDMDYISRYIETIYHRAKDKQSASEFSRRSFLVANFIIRCCVPKESQHLILCDNIWT